jgi:hypothetical protein
VQNTMPDEGGNREVELEREVEGGSLDGRNGSAEGHGAFLRVLAPAFLQLRGGDLVLIVRPGSWNLDMKPWRSWR